MDQNQIKSHLQKLHKELREVTSADDETRLMLSQLDEDIHKLLEQDDVEGQPVDDDNIAERMDEMVVHFSASHPKAAMTIREIMDMLAKMGI